MQSINRKQKNGQKKEKQRKKKEKKKIKTQTKPLRMSREVFSMRFFLNCGVGKQVLFRHVEEIQFVDPIGENVA